MKLDLSDVTEAGLILRDGSMTPWMEIEVVGKCEHPCSDSTWAHYYLRKRGDHRNYKIPALGGFNWFGLKGGDQIRQRDLKRKIIELGKKFPDVLFVSRMPIFGKESPWDTAKEMQWIRYCDVYQMEHSCKNNDEFVCVYTTHNQVDAEVVKSGLEGRGIQAIMETYGDVEAPSSLLHNVKIFVPQSECEMAKSFLSKK